MDKKCLLLYSNGLDSRLALKIMKEKGYSVSGVYLKLPFSKDFSDESKNFFKEENSDLIVVDCTKGKRLKEYLDLVLNPVHRVGSGINPCYDCKIFMFKIAKEIADENEIELIVSGEVIGQRPMSQTQKGLDLIEDKSGLSNRVLRPLSEKVISKAKGISGKEYFGISGRQRNLQIELAEKYKIEYPSPAGGCLLCEKLLKNRFEFLLKNNLITEKTLDLISIGRHFNIKRDWFVVARNEEESKIIDSFENSVLSKPKNPSVYFHNPSKKETALKLQKAYSEKKYSSFEERKL